MRLICWLVGRHLWGDWQKVVIAGWTTNMRPEARYCHRCWTFEENRSARIFSKIAFHDDGKITTARNALA